MNIAFKSIAAASLLAVGMAVMPAHAAVAVPPQEHHDMDHPEYAHNRYYRVGNDEGWKDHQRNVRRADTEHRHKFHSDDDRKAHDYGYEQGWNGHRYNERPH